MNWRQAEPLILAKITQGLHLDKTHSYKIVTEIPPYACHRNNFHGAPGFKIQVGRNSFVEVPLDMLQFLLLESMANKKLYCREVFRAAYPHLLKTKPCYVHVVGKIFERAKVAVNVNSRSYIIN